MVLSNCYTDCGWSMPGHIEVNWKFLSILASVSLSVLIKASQTDFTLKSNNSLRWYYYMYFYRWKNWDFCMPNQAINFWESIIFWKISIKEFRKFKTH